MNKIFLNRYELACSLLPSDTSSLLDVGCRDAILKRYLQKHIAYTGADMIDGPGVDHVCNLEKGLPFSDDAFDVVTALDVLEHTDDIWRSFEELVRVARRQVIIVLPNLYHWSLRVQYMTGREMGKYRLTPDIIQDRHRWLVSYNTANEFSRGMALKYGLSLHSQVMFGSRRYLPIDLFLNLFSKNVGAWSVAFVFTKEKLSDD